jgi:hypothetical protein
MQGAHGQVGKHRQGQCREDHSFAAQPSVQAGGLAGVCSDHVRHGSRVGMEGIHRGETSRRRRRAEMPVCGAQIAMSTRCTSEIHVARSVCPRRPRRPRPHPGPLRTFSDMENCAHGTHCLTGTMHTIRALLQLARTKPGRPGKSAMPAGSPQRSARSWCPRSWQHPPKV